jgi:hypothetical protein
MPVVVQQPTRANRFLGDLIMGGVGGIGGMGAVGGGMAMGTSVAGVAGSSAVSAGGANAPAAAATAAPAPGTTVSISQAAQQALNAEVGQVGASFTVSASETGVQVTGTISGLESGQLGTSVNAELTVDIGVQNLSGNSSEAMNHYDELIASLILALLMQEQKKSDITIEIG